MAADLFRADAHEKSLLWRGVPFCGPSLFGHRCGAFHAPGGSLLFCFGCAALRVTVSLAIFFGRVPPKRFLRTLRKCRASALGSMAHSPEPCPDQRRDKFNKTETLSCTRTK